MEVKDDVEIFVINFLCISLNKYVWANLVKKIRKIERKYFWANVICISMEKRRRDDMRRDARRYYF